MYEPRTVAKPFAATFVISWTCRQFSGKSYFHGRTASTSVLRRDWSEIMSLCEVSDNRFLGVLVG